MPQAVVDGHQAVIDLFHHRWNIPVLWEISESGGARLVELTNRLSATRNPLRAALTSLQALGLVRENPGYGHPLRPEFLLTELGRRVALIGHTYRAIVDNADLAALKWTAPVLLALRDNSRFTSIHDQLGIGPRPLAETLKQLVEADLVQRLLEDTHPPRASYRLAATGKEAAVELAALAHALTPSPPRP